MTRPTFNILEEHRHAVTGLLRDTYRLTYSDAVDAITSAAIYIDKAQGYPTIDEAYWLACYAVAAMRICKIKK